MQNQEIFNQISKIDTSSIKDSSLKNTLYLSLNLDENLQQEIIELKKTNKSLRDEINRLKGEQSNLILSLIPNPNPKTFLQEAKRVKRKNITRMNVTINIDHSIHKEWLI